MAVKLVVTLDAPDDALAGYGAGARLHIQSGASETGTFASLTVIAIAAATYQYEYWDTAGDVTTWYRWRIENAGGTETGDWAAAIQGWDPATAARNSGSYATVDDFLLRVPTIPANSRTLAAIERALVESRERLDAELGYDYFRHPQSGTEQRTFHGPGTNLLHVHQGIISLTTVEVRLSTNGSWIALDADDWWLETQPGDLWPKAGEPYFHVRLSDLATYVIFPKGENRVRLTGAFGWPSVRRFIEGNIAWARQQLAADLSFPGGIVGSDELGRPVGPNRMPDAVWRLKLAESRRFACSI